MRDMRTNGKVTGNPRLTVIDGANPAPRPVGIAKGRDGAMVRELAVLDGDIENDVGAMPADGLAEGHGPGDPRGATAQDAGDVTGGTSGEEADGAAGGADAMGDGMPVGASYSGMDGGEGAGDHDGGAATGDAGAEGDDGSGAGAIGQAVRDNMPFVVAIGAAFAAWLLMRVSRATDQLTIAVLFALFVGAGSFSLVILWQDKQEAERRFRHAAAVDAAKNEIKMAHVSDGDDGSGS